MKQKTKLKWVLLFAFFLLMMWTIPSKAGEVNLNQLTIEAHLLSNGDMKVTEIWDADISETNTMYKTFATDQTKYGKITDVSVYDETGYSKKLTETSQWAYHVPKGSYYGTLNEDGDFEIGWGVGLDHSHSQRQYKIEYTVEEAVTKYQDCSELYWQFVGKDFEPEIKQIMGSIYLPKKANAIEDIRVWGHTQSLNGQIYASDFDLVNFSAYQIQPGNFVEVRVLMPTDMISYSQRTINENHLETVLKEEEKWANEANFRRNILPLLIGLAVSLVGIALLIWLVKKMIKDKKLYRELPEKIKPEQQYDYYRELPREEAVPGEAIFLLKKKWQGLDSSDEIGKVFSSILLDLKLKKHIEIQVLEPDKKKSPVNIQILNKEEKEKLPPEERAVFQFLLDAFGEKKEMKLKELQKYLQNHTSKVLALKSELNSFITLELEQNHQVDEEAKKTYSKYLSQIVLIIIGLFSLLVISSILLGMIGMNYLVIGVIAILAIAFVVELVISANIIGKVNVFTASGIEQSEQWKGLKKYMEDFSLLNEKEIPAIEIWEKYLVFATAFGIADKVAKQLKMVYPEINETQMMTTYSCIYLATHTSFNQSFSQAISSSMSSAYTSASGGGGGFSGGGGGGRWTAAVEEEDDLTSSSFFGII